MKCDVHEMWLAAAPAKEYLSGDLNNEAIGYHETKVKATSQIRPSAKILQNFASV